MYSGFVGVQIALAFVFACVRGLHCIRVLGIQSLASNIRLGSVWFFISVIHLLGAAFAGQWC